MKMTVIEHELNYKILDDGRCLPSSCEILEQVGLAGIADKISRFYDLLEVADPNEIFKWVAYTADVKAVQAKSKVIKYLLLDCGCRMCSGTTEQIRVEEFNWLRNFLSGLEVEKIYSFEEVAKMLNDTGFNVKIHQD